MTEIQCATCGLVAPVTIARAQSSPGSFAQKDMAVVGIDGVRRCQAHPTPATCPHFQAAIDVEIEAGHL
jgi:hypothetical protein